MSQVVEPDPSYAGRRDQLIEEPVQVARLDDGPDGGGEDEPGLGQPWSESSASTACRARCVCSTLTDRAGSGTVRRDRSIFGLP